MVARILIIGGYGNFGSYIARSLAADKNIRLLIGGRSADKAQAFATSLDVAHAAEGHAIDIDGDLAEALARIAPDIVIHTTGPFQMQDHRVARECIAQGCHYLDLADAREFVATIDRLDADAIAKGVLVVSGASSVPCLTAAVIDHYLPAFRPLEADRLWYQRRPAYQSWSCYHLGGAQLCRQAGDDAARWCDEDGIWLGG